MSYLKMGQEDFSMEKRGNLTSTELFDKVDTVAGRKVIIMDNLRRDMPELFGEDGAMDWRRFEEEIRPKYPIQVRHDKQSISVTLSGRSDGRTFESIAYLLSLHALSDEPSRRVQGVEWKKD